ncbi:hypothetical protein [Paenibacillus humicola]|uniref:hypothetical protein n=1 Tax=Paenibacillus humicola TaxID=3110540 RepID=UPI00237B402D|nr:hypothetical protein [Paenibacillus humicola]
MNEQNFRRELASAGRIDEAQAREWVSGTIPMAARYIEPAEADTPFEIRMHLRFAEPSAVPLGRWMGCYPELIGGQGDLTIIADWSFSLYAQYLSIEAAFEDEAERTVLQHAFLDRSRIKIGIANDVYQPFAPLPEAYSMVRHHSLMLYMSLDWLTREEKERWTAISRRAGEAVAGMLEESADPLETVRRWEHDGRRVMLETGPMTVSAEGMERILRDEDIMRDVKRYYALTYFGIGVLAYDHARAGGTEAWKREQIGALPQADYMERLILDYLADCRKGRAAK